MPHHLSCHPPAKVLSSSCPEGVSSAWVAFSVSEQVQRGLADRFQADAARVLRDEGLGIQPAQFPLLAAVDRYGPLTINDAAAALGVSQPAATRTAASVKWPAARRSPA